MNASIVTVRVRLDMSEFSDDLTELIEQLEALDRYVRDEWADERDVDDLSQNPLWNDRPSFDPDVYYDGFGEP